MPPSKMFRFSVPTDNPFSLADEKVAFFLSMCASNVSSASLIHTNGCKLEMQLYISVGFCFNGRFSVKAADEREVIAEAHE